MGSVRGPFRNAKIARLQLTVGRGKSLTGKAALQSSRIAAALLGMRAEKRQVSRASSSLRVSMICKRSPRVRAVMTISSPPPPETLECTPLLLGVGCPAFQVIMTIGHHLHQALHPVGIALKGLHVGQGLCLGREAGIGLAVGLADSPSLAGFAGLKKLTGDILDCCHGDSPYAFEPNDRPSLMSRQLHPSIWPRASSRPPWTAPVAWIAGRIGCHGTAFLTGGSFSPSGGLAAS